MTLPPSLLLKCCQVAGLFYSLTLAISPSVVHMDIHTWKFITFCQLLIIRIYQCRNNRLVRLSWCMLASLLWSYSPGVGGINLFWVTLPTTINYTCIGLMPSRYGLFNNSATFICSFIRARLGALCSMQNRHKTLNFRISYSVSRDCFPRGTQQPVLKSTSIYSQGNLAGQLHLQNRSENGI